MNREFFLALVRLGLNKYEINEEQLRRFPTDIDWESIREIALYQGVFAIVLDGIEALLKENIRINLPEKRRLAQWVGEVLQRYEFRFELYTRALSEIGSFYHEHGFKMMLLKGFACGLDWPKPDHRPCGDIDIWLFGQQRKADALMAREKGIKIDSSHHHHTVFHWGDFIVENHYNFINIYDHRSSRHIEEQLKEIASRGFHSMCIHGTELCYPTANFNALFLLRHISGHFSAAGMVLRQVLDWGFFIEKHHGEINWTWYVPYLKEEGMWDFFLVLNTICVDYLCFDKSFFHGYISDDSVIVEHVFNDMMYPEDAVHEDGHIIKSVWIKFSRWWHNRWKHRMCYPDSLLSAFVNGVWSKVLKPRHFVD